MAGPQKGGVYVRVTIDGGGPDLESALRAELGAQAQVGAGEGEGKTFLVVCAGEGDSSVDLRSRVNTAIRVAEAVTNTHAALKKVNDG